MENCWTVTELGYIYQHDNDLPEGENRSILYELENLFVDGKTERMGSDYMIRHDAAAAFDETEREVLHLPAIFPYVMSITNKGNLASERFHYMISFLQSNGTKFVNPEIIGSYIKVPPAVDYIFNPAQYDIVRTIQLCNEKVKNLSGTERLMFNCEHLAEIKRLAGTIDVKLNKFLKSQNIVVPDKLSITVKRTDDGNYLVKPVLLKAKDESFESLTGTDSFTAAFDKQKTANSTYAGTDGKKYIIKPEIKKGLQEIKDKEIVKKEDLERIEKQPKETFTSDAFEFDLSDYSDRVVSIGEFVKKNLPYIKFSEGSWLPAEGSVSLLGDEPADSLPEINRNNVVEILEKVKRAHETDQQNIQYNGKTYPVTEALVRNAQAIYEEFFDSDKTEADSQQHSGSKKTFKALNIKDNVETLEYESRKKIYETLTERMFDGLNEGIKLYDHQKQGVQWMFACWKDGHRGVLLADDMGLGKTMQAYTFISGLKLSSPQQDIKSVLVVAPVSLLKNWEDEFQKFVRPHLFENVIKLYGGAIRTYKVHGHIDLRPIARNRLILTTYETLRDYQLSMGCMDWSVMVIDEAQKIKNPTTMVTTAVKGMKYDFGIALTGTPVENTWNDLWSIMDFVAPGKLGSLKEFNQEYQSKLKRIKGDKKALYTLGEQLQQNLQPVFKRRLKKDILNELPEKHIIKVEEPMPLVQQREYESIIRNVKDYKKKIGKGQILRVIANLRDVSLCPGLGIYKDTAFMNQDIEKVIHSSARLMKTFEILDDIQQRDEKVIIFVTSRKMQRIIKFLIEKKYQISVPPAINGAMQSERRQEVVSDFCNTKGFRILLLSVEAGGVGFNITAANNVIHLSRCWNPAKEDQATDRVYRIGQDKDVNVYLPLAYDPNYPKDASFDEKLDHLLDYKRQLSDSVLYPTGDSSDDGLSIFEDIFSQESTVNDETETYGNSYWSIEDMENVEGLVFEEIIGKLFEAIDGYDVEVTPSSNDKGADVVVKKNDGKTGLLIQCKQTAADKNMNQSGVVEVYGALSYYSDLYDRKFKGIVITNAKGYTENAHELAQVNHVRLIAHDELDALLKKYPVRKM